MTDIQENIDQILSLFERAANVEGCSYVDVEEMIELMNEEISIINDDYEGSLLGGVINPLFKKLDTALIVSSYVKNYTNNVITYSSLMEQEHIILASQMTDKMNKVSDEIKKLKLKMCNK